MQRHQSSRPRSAGIPESQGGARLRRKSGVFEGALLLTAPVVLMTTLWWIGSTWGDVGGLPVVAGIAAWLSLTVTCVWALHRHFETRARAVDARATQGDAAALPGAPS